MQSPYERKKRARLTNKDFSIIASNCNGAIMIHFLGCRFNSPFVNLWIRPDDYIKMLGDLGGYLSKQLTFTTEVGISYPVGLLGDIRIYFQHYKTEAEAREKWEERLKRINWENLFILFTERDGCTERNLRDFDSMPYEHKAVLTHKPYPDIKSARYLSAFQNNDEVGDVWALKKNNPMRKRIDDFDYVGWLNGES